MIRVANLSCGECINDFEKGGFEAFFKKADREDFIRVLEKLDDFDYIAVPGYLVEKMKCKEFFELLEGRNVIASTYFNGSLAEFSHFIPSYVPGVGYIVNDSIKKVSSTLITPLPINFDLSKIGDVLRILRRLEFYSRYHARKVWLRMQSVEFVFSASSNFETFLKVASAYQLRCAKYTRSRLSAKATRFLPSELGFHFSFGTANSLEEFCLLLSGANDTEVKEYISRNDFSKWIEHVLGDRKLASDVSSCRSKDEVLKTIKNRYEFYCKRLNYP